MVTIEKVDEAGAQRLADETGKVVYMREHWSMARPTSRCPQMTTDRDEAVSWGEFTAFVPRREQNYAHISEIGSWPEPEPEPQLRVVRVLELRGPQSWMEKALANSWLSETEPRHGKSQGGAWEVVEQIRTTERLCGWCGGEHLGQCSEDGCSANPAVSRHRGGK